MQWHTLSVSNAGKLTSPHFGHTDTSNIKSPSLKIVSKKTILQTYLDDKNNKHIGLFTTATTERLKQDTKTATNKYEEYKTYAESLDDKVLTNAVTANEADILKQTKFAEATKDLNQELLKGIKYNTDYAESENLLSKNAKSMSSSFSGIKGKLSSLGSSLKNLAVGIGNMLIIQAVMSAISFGFEALDNYINRAENNLSDLEKIATEINDKKDAYTSHSTSVNKIKNEYYELADGVNSYGENISLTSTQYERYIELNFDLN